MPVLALELIPLAVASALLPLPLIVTVLLLRSQAGRVAAVAWTAGMAATRLVQGALAALLLDRVFGAAGDGAKGPVVSTLLIVLALLFYALAVRKLANAPDDDAPPPRWMESLESATPGRAFALGCGLMALSVKSWVFTLSAAAAIADARLETSTAALAYVGFVLLAQGLQLLLLALAFLVPARADAVLAWCAEQLDRYSRPLLIAVGLLFGTVFLLEGLAGLGLG
jgi:hypothetical protein